MGKPAFEFIDGHKPAPAAIPQVKAYLDVQGEMLAIRMRHSRDDTDQQILSIEPVDGRLTIRVRDLYPRSAPALCALFGIDLGDWKGAGRFSWPIVMAANPDIHGMDHVMIIRDGESDGDRDALEQCLKNLIVATQRYIAAPIDFDSGLIDLEKSVFAGIAEAEDLISGDLEYSGSSAIVHAALEREAAMLAAMARTNAAAKALLGSNDIMSDTPFGDDLEEAIAAQAEFIKAAEGQSEDADQPIGEASPEIARAADRAYADAGIMPVGEYVAKHGGEPFKITTGDPSFDPEGPARINGFLYLRAGGDSDEE